jgi:hypothetical protein
MRLLSYFAIVMLVVILIDRMIHGNFGGKR